MASDLTPDAPDIGDWLARMAPPDTPAEAEELCPELNEFTINLDPMRSAAVLAGLMTDLRFQANHIRIDFAMRLVLARGCGKRKVGHDALDRLLNHALVEARVASLEDPIEDFFTDVLPTMHGRYAAIHLFVGKSGVSYRVLAPRIHGAACMGRARFGNRACVCTAQAQ